MLVLDLKLALFLVLLAIVVPVVALLLLQRGRRSRLRAPSREALAVLDSMPFGALILSKAELLYVNDAGRRLLGVESGGLPDTEWRALLDQDRAECRSPAGPGSRYRTVTLASGRTLQWVLTASEDRDVVFVLDITAQQRTEQSSRMLISDLGHELRTPIATLLTHLEILGLQDLQEELRQQSLSLARSEAQRMARLVNDLLELGRMETAETLVRRPVDLAALVEQVVLQAAPRASAGGVALSMDADAALPWVYGNPDRLRQLFLNLIDNAAKYAGSQARVVVSLRRAPAGVLCAVTDSGPGVSPEHLPYLARRFYRVAPERGEGSGLGLAMVAEILRHHESMLDLRSPLDEAGGFAASFTLPFAEER